MQTLKYWKTDRQTDRQTDRFLQVALYGFKLDHEKYKEIFLSTEIVNVISL